MFPVHPELPVPKFRRRERKKAGMRAVSLGLGGLLALACQYEPLLAYVVQQDVVVNTTVGKLCLLVGDNQVSHRSIFQCI